MTKELAALRLLTPVIFLDRRLPFRSAQRDAQDDERVSCVLSDLLTLVVLAVALKDNSLHPVDEFVITELELA